MHFNLDSFDRIVERVLRGLAVPFLNLILVSWVLFQWVSAAGVTVSMAPWMDVFQGIGGETLDTLFKDLAEKAGALTPTDLAAFVGAVIRGLFQGLESASIYTLLLLIVVAVSLDMVVRVLGHAAPLRICVPIAAVMGLPSVQQGFARLQSLGAAAPDPDTAPGAALPPGAVFDERATWLYIRRHLDVDGAGGLYQRERDALMSRMAALDAAFAYCTVYAGLFFVTSIVAGSFIGSINFLIFLVFLGALWALPRVACRIQELIVLNDLDCAYASVRPLPFEVSLETEADRAERLTKRPKRVAEILFVSWGWYAE